MISVMSNLVDCIVDQLFGESLSVYWIHLGQNKMATVLQTAFSLNENVWISIKVSPKFVPRGPIDNTPALASNVSF